MKRFSFMKKVNHYKLAAAVTDSIVSAIKFNGKFRSNLTLEEDPTGQGRNRLELNKKLKARLASAQSEVIKRFNTIPRKARRERNIQLNEESFTVYDYDNTPEEQDGLEAEIAVIIALWLLQSQTANKPANFYADANVDTAYRSGALETMRDTNKDLSTIKARGLLKPSMPKAVDQSKVLFSQEYLDELLSAKNDLFYDIKGMSRDASAKVYERINAGMKAGKTPSDIIADIKKRFAAAESSAKRIVVTRINKVHADAIVDTVDFINDNELLNVGVKHISALLPTTRPPHAARHLNNYTTAQQNRWWDSGANRINCHCSVRVVILDSKDDEILKDE